MPRPRTPVNTPCDVSIANVGGLAGADDEDVLEYTGSGLAMHYALSASGLDGVRVDVGGIDLTPVVLFADGFASGTTDRWSVATP